MMYIYLVNKFSDTHIKEGLIVTTKAKFNIPMDRPYIGEEEKQAVMRVLDSGHLPQGPVVKEFEERFAELCDTKHAIATSSGTTALTTALIASGVEPDDEVIIPPFSFVATATSVLSARANPVFVDIEPDTFNIDPTKIEAAITERTTAIMPVHLYGHPADMKAIKAIADKHNIALIEDAAQAHGAEIDGQPVGGWGMAGFSLYASKNMMSGEGGMVTTNNDELAEKARMVRNHGMHQRYFHEIVGFNFRLTDVMAAIGVEQSKRLTGWNAKRRENAQYYSKHLEGVKVPQVREGYTSAWHQYTITVPEGADRDSLVKGLQEHGIGAYVFYPLPIHQQPMLQDFISTDSPPDLPVTLNLTKRVISLPVNPFVTDEERDYIVETVNRLVKTV